MVAQLLCPPDTAAVFADKLVCGRDILPIGILGWRFPLPGEVARKDTKSFWVPPRCTCASLQDMVQRQELLMVPHDDWFQEIERCLSLGHGDQMLTTSMSKTDVDATLAQTLQT